MYEEIIEHWNNKDLKNTAELTAEVEDKITLLLEHYSVDGIKNLINRCSLYLFEFADEDKLISFEEFIDKKLQVIREQEEDRQDILKCGKGILTDLMEDIEKW